MFEDVNQMLCFRWPEIILQVPWLWRVFKGETLTSVSSIVYTSADAETHRRQKVNHRRVVKVGVNLDARYFSTSHMLFTLLMKIRAKPSRWKLGNVAKRCIT